MRKCAGVGGSLAAALDRSMDATAQMQKSRLRGSFALIQEMVHHLYLIYEVHIGCDRDDAALVA